MGLSEETIKSTLENVGCSYIWHCVLAPIVQSIVHSALNLLMIFFNLDWLPLACHTPPPLPSTIYLSLAVKRADPQAVSGIIMEILAGTLNSINLMFHQMLQIGFKVGNFIWPVKDIMHIEIALDREKLQQVFYL